MAIKFPGMQQEVSGQTMACPHGCYSLGHSAKADSSRYTLPTPDLIVLFTDGHPHVPSAIETGYATKILREVASGEKVPILAVAVGSYEFEGIGGPREKPNAAIAFLKRLAHQTGGTFIGR